MELAIESASQTYVSLNTVLVVAAATLFVYWAYLSTRRPKNCPPGPPAVPILGSLPYMNVAAIHEDFIEKAEKYGQIFSYYSGNRLTVVLNDYESIKEGFVNHAVEFAGRPQGDPRIKASNPYQTGILLTSYSTEWKHQRGNALTIMRNLGWGKRSLEDRIREESKVLMEVFRSKAGQPFDPNKIIGTSVSNVICSMLFGDRYDHDDAEFTHLLHLVDSYFINRFGNSLVTYIPLLRLTKKYKEGQRRLLEFNEEMFAYSSQKIREGRERLEAGQEPCDFIMGYLKELDHIAEGQERRISEDWLPALIKDFFLAGAETSTTTLTWMVLFMAKNPEVQRKIQAEVDATFGERGAHRVSLDDKSRLPYTEACVHESQRMASIASLALPHTTIADVKVRDWVIPKDTLVLANLYNVCTDKKLWGDPENFRPERFFDETGKPSKPEYWIPYSMGRRMCLGEQLARQELFIFFTNLVNHFHIRFPEGQSHDLSANVAGVRHPTPFQLIFEPRF